MTTMGGPPAGAAGRIRGMLAVTLLAAVPAACTLVEPPGPSTQPFGSIPSGVRGQVLVGPTCTPPASGPACLEPYAARLVVLDTDGEVVAEIATDPRGRFEALLPPGTYTIVPVPGGDPYPTAGLLSVTVVEGAFTDVEVRYGSGLKEGA